WLQRNVHAPVTSRTQLWRPCHCLGGHLSRTCCRRGFHPEWHLSRHHCYVAYDLHLQLAHQQCPHRNLRELGAVRGLWTATEHLGVGRSGRGRLHGDSRIVAVGRCRG